MRRIISAVLTLLPALVLQGCDQLAEQLPDQLSDRLSDSKCAALVVDRDISGGSVGTTPSSEPACLYEFERLGVSLPILMELRREAAGWQLGRGWVEGAEAADLAEAKILAKTVFGRRVQSNRINAQLELPNSTSWRQFPPWAAVIEISKNRMIRAGKTDDNQVPLEADYVGQFSKNALQAHPDLPMELTVDRASAADFAIKVLRAIQEAGYEVVNIRTEPPEGQAAQGDFASIGGFEARLTGLEFYKLSTEDLGRGTTFGELIGRLEAGASQ